MTTIILDFASRFAEHITGKSVSRFEYLRGQFLNARQIATPNSPIAVRGILAPYDLKSVNKHLNLKPIRISTIETNKAYDVTFIIKHNQSL